MAYLESRLLKLHQEILAYPNESSLWITAPGINNSAGNLCYHILGNLNHYIGATIGQNGYVRNRPLEFTIRSVPIQDLEKGIFETIHMIKTTLESVEDLNAPYPKAAFNQEGTIAFFLMRVLLHIDYHLGQINYHRRLLT